MEKYNSSKEVPTLSLIQAQLESMTPKQKRIAQYLLKNPEAPIRKSITTLAQEIGVKSESSLVRFYRMLGFEGYHDFKVTLARETAGQAFYHSHEDISVDDTTEKVIYKIFHGAMLSLEANLKLNKHEQYLKAQQLLLSSRRIVFLGYAASGSIASFAYFRFTDLGFNCHFSSDSHVNAALLAEPNQGDVAFCISHSGETKDIVNPLQKVHKSIPVISITGFENSSLAQISDVSFITVTEETNYRTDAMTSRIIQMTIIDSLFTIMSLAMGERAMDRLKKTRHALSNYKT